MTESADQISSRRQFLANTGRVAAATSLAGLVVPRVHAAADETVQVALIGCGGRGTGAAVNALAAEGGPLKLVAMADVFDNRLQSSLGSLKGKFGDQVDVPKDRQFVGFDGYQKAMDCLRPGDIAIFATPPAFRWVHFRYAVSKDLNVFMEKPLTVDGPTSRRILELGKQAEAKNLKVGVGLMSRHNRGLQELHQRIQDGEIGDIVTMRGYRMQGQIGSAFSERWPGDPSELMWQIQRFHSFIWASGGCFNDFYIHIVDHCCWMKNAWPVSAQALGGRHYKNGPQGKPCVDQNFDSYSVEYLFEDGARLIMDGRCMNGCQPIYNSYAHGTKGSAVLSNSGDCGLPSSIYSGQKPDPARRRWESKVPRDQRSPYDNEWDDLVQAIRNDQAYNEVEHGVYGSLVSSLGRKAAHTGKEITLDALLNSEDEYAPTVDQLTMDSPPPLVSDENGRYPVPQPGILGDREY